MHSMVSWECHVQSCLDHVPVEFLVQGFLFTKRTEWRPVSDKQPVASGRWPAVFQVIDDCPADVLQQWEFQGLPGFLHYDMNRLAYPVDILKPEAAYVTDPQSQPGDHQ